MRFAKMHGAGNDFVIVDARQIHDMRQDWAEIAKVMCDRHFGVGSDGLVLVLPSGAADFKMRMFNPDGSEAEMCGNGIRCFAKYVADNGMVDRRIDWLAVETLAGVKQVQLLRQKGAVERVQVSMGVPGLRPSEIPVALDLDGGGEPAALMAHPLTVGASQVEVTCVSMGNPHAVAFLQTPVADFPLHDVGPRVEHHPLFPKRVNFEIVNVEDRGHLAMRVWERGAGETLACGTGACAVAVAARLHGLTDDVVDITLPGGTLTVAWDGEGEVLLTGPAVLVFEGVWQVKIRF